MNLAFWHFSRHSLLANLRSWICRHFEVEQLNAMPRPTAPKQVGHQDKQIPQWQGLFCNIIARVFVNNVEYCRMWRKTFCTSSSNFFNGFATSFSVTACIVVKRMYSTDKILVPDINNNNINNNNNNNGDNTKWTASPWTAICLVCALELGRMKNSALLTSFWSCIVLCRASMHDATSSSPIDDKKTHQVRRNFCYSSAARVVFSQTCVSADKWW